MKKELGSIIREVEGNYSRDQGRFTDKQMNKHGSHL